MKLFKTITEIIESRKSLSKELTTNEDGFSMMQGVMSIAIMSALTVVGAGSYDKLIGEAHNAVIANSVDTLITNVALGELDFNDETNEQTVVEDYNIRNASKGVVAYAEKTGDCVVIRVVNESQNKEQVGNNGACRGVDIPDYKYIVPEPETIDEDTTLSSETILKPLAENMGIPREVMEAVVVGDN